MLSPLLSGKVVEVKENGQYKINDVVMKIEDEHGQIHECTLCQKWPIKQARPTLERLPISIPLVTGQRVIDTYSQSLKVELLLFQVVSVLVKQ